MKMDNNPNVAVDSNCKAKKSFKSSSSLSLFKSIVQLRTSLNEGYRISCITHPATSTDEYSTMVDLIDPNDGKECLITVFGYEAIALSEFVEWVLNSMN
jgi:ribulose bisphosphate carboxylase small subunit